MARTIGINLGFKLSGYLSFLDLWIYNPFLVYMLKRKRKRRIRRLGGGTLPQVHDDMLTRAM